MVWEKFEDDVLESLRKVDKDISKEELEEPPEGMGDLAFPCFSLSKKYKKKPVEISKELAGKLKRGKYTHKIETKGPYINFFINHNSLAKILSKELQKSYGYINKGQGGSIIIEHTSINPNASPHMGRARNAIIGDAVCNLLSFVNYNVGRYYFVNDMGKQMAILLYSVRDKDLSNVTFDKILDLYIEANKNMDDSSEKKVFEILKNIEKKDKGTLKRMKKLVDICVEGQMEILKYMGIGFDKMFYESDYLLSGGVKKVLDELDKTGKLFVDENGRKVLDLSGYDLPMKNPVLVLTRKDGTSLYPLRDLAFSIDKLKEGGKNIIVLGEDQKLYLKQINSALDVLGYPRIEGIFYSYVLLTTGKMSTRSGRLVLLEDFLKEAETNAEKEIKKRYGEGKNLAKGSRDVANAAVKYSILNVSPEKNITFDLDKAMKFEGDTGPYLQYTYARSSSILKKSGTSKVMTSTEKINLESDMEKQLLKKISKFPKVVEKSSENLKVHYITNYCHELAELFNSFYHSHPVLNSKEPQRSTRLFLVRATKTTLYNALKILGIKPLEKM